MATEKKTNRESTKRKAKKKMGIWVDLFLWEKHFGEFQTVMERLKIFGDEKWFKGFIRMDPDLFKEIVVRVGPRIRKEDTKYRLAVPVEVRIAIALRFVATGESYRALEYHFRVPHSLICNIVREVMEAIYQEFQDALQCPNKSEQWKQVADDFFQKWQYPNCIGAVDGKHINIRATPDSGTIYFNYKKFFFIVLMAVVDAKYRFLSVSVGSLSSNSDKGIFNLTGLSSAIEGKYAGLADPDVLVGMMY